MLDWFVLLVPLAVLPIILLFAFVGCPLDRSGQATSLPFSWGPGLGNGDVTSIVVTFTASVAEGEGGGSVFKGPTTVTLSGAQLVTGGTVGITFLTLQDYGPVTGICTVTGTVAAGNLPDPLPPKEKLEDEPPPPFHLSRDSSGRFHLT